MTSKAELRKFILDHTTGLSRGIEDGASIGTRTSARLIEMLDELPADPSEPGPADWNSPESVERDAE